MDNPGSASQRRSSPCCHAAKVAAASARSSCPPFRSLRPSLHLRLLARHLVGRYLVHLKKSSSGPSTKKEMQERYSTRRRDDVGRLEKTRELAFARQSNTSGRDVCEGVAVFRQMFSVVCTELSPIA